MDGWMDRTKIEGWLEGQKNVWLNGYKNSWMVGWTEKNIKMVGWI